jgi:hypothetical protein
MDEQRQTKGKLNKIITYSVKRFLTASGTLRWCNEQRKTITFSLGHIIINCQCPLYTLKNNY